MTVGGGEEVRPSITLFTVHGWRPAGQGGGGQRCAKPITSSGDRRAATIRLSPKETARVIISWTRRETGWAGASESRQASAVCPLGRPPSVRTESPFTGVSSGTTAVSPGQHQGRAYLRERLSGSVEAVRPMRLISSTASPRSSSPSVVEIWLLLPVSSNLIRRALAGISGMAVTCPMARVQTFCKSRPGHTAIPLGAAVIQIGASAAAFAGDPSDMPELVVMDRLIENAAIGGTTRQAVTVPGRDARKAEAGSRRCCPHRRRAFAISGVPEPRPAAGSRHSSRGADRGGHRTRG